MIYNQLDTMYSEIENIIDINELSPRPESVSIINEKLCDLTTFIHKNGEKIKNDLTANKDHASILLKISQLNSKGTQAASLASKIKDIHNACARLELKVLLNENNPKKLADWVLKNRHNIKYYGNTQDFFEDISSARKHLIKANLLTPEVGKSLSRIITIGLGFEGIKEVSYLKTHLPSIIKNQEQRLEALAHWINAGEIPLRDAFLSSKSELRAIAPYLHYVNCINLNLLRSSPLGIFKLEHTLSEDDLTSFIKSCSNAHHLSVNSEILTELKDLPEKLISIKLYTCSELKTIDLSKNLQLQTFSCYSCPIITLDFSKNLLLRELVCQECDMVTEIDMRENLELQELCIKSCYNLRNIDVSKNVEIQKIFINNCYNLRHIDVSKNSGLITLNLFNSPINMLDVSHNPQLQHLELNKCPIGSSFDLSQNQQLLTLICKQCPIPTLDVSQNLNLTAIDFSGCSITNVNLSNNPNLMKVACNDCRNLTSIGDTLSNFLIELSCENCPNLTQLPQFPPTATVYLSQSYLSQNFLSQIYSILNYLSESSNNSYQSFAVYPTELEETPKKVLLKLGRFLLQDQPMPYIIYMNPITGQPADGLDAEGLRRQLVATLCENLFVEGKGLSFKKELDYVTPTLKENENPDALRTFARLMGLSATSQLPTGTNLDPAFFHGIFSLSDQELNEVTIPLPEPLKIKLYMARQGLPPEEYDETEAEGLKKESDVLLATAVIAKELKTLLGDRFSQFGRNVNKFIVDVQGIPGTKEIVKKRFVCDNAEYKEWIDSFIDKLPLKSGNARYELKHLLLLLTGSYTLSGEDKIKFEVFPTRKHIESSTVIHTCFKSMELPGDLTENLLHKELEAQLKLLKVFNAA